jgi:hypothetical protein
LRIQRRTIAALVAIIAGAFLLPASAMAMAPQPVSQPSQQCDRHCLLSLATAYTEAVTDDKPSEVPVAADVRVTDNGELSTLGRGQVWGQPRRFQFRHTLVDPDTGQIVFYGTVTDSPQVDPATWWFYAVRLRVEHRVITEVEEIATDSKFVTPASDLRLPDRTFDTVLPTGERQSRQQLIALANRYFDVVTGGEGSDAREGLAGVFHPDCQRMELGTFTTNSDTAAGSCVGEFADPGFRWPVSNRRFPVVDTERGVVVGMALFGDAPGIPNSGSVVVEAFKVEDGLIRHIFAFFRGGQTESGWPAA